MKPKLLKVSEKARKRFWSKVDKISDPNGCWLWTAALNRKKYGQFRYKGKTRIAHRLSYAMHKGRIPKNKTIDHLCCVRHCINPEHLEAVTCKVNILRGEGIPALNARKTHCIRGHEFTVASVTPSGSRQCRICQQNYNRKYRIDHSKCFKEYSRQWRIDHPEYERKRYLKKKQLEKVNVERR